MKKYRRLSLLLAFVIALNTLHAQPISGYHVAATYHIGGSGGWDFIAVDPGSNKLYQSHATVVNVLDRTTGDSVGIIKNTTGVHGIAFVDELGKGYTSNGKINTVTAFDLKTDSILSQIATGQNPDAILYDPFSKKIITCNGKSKNLSIIDPITDKVIDSIAVGGKPEVPVTDEEGNIYVNIEDKNEIVKVDMKKMEVTDHWPLVVGEGPTGLAIDTKTKRLFSGCDNKLLVVMDANNGKIIDTLTIGNGCDGVGFDTTLHYVFASCGEGTVTVINEIAGNDFKSLDIVPTKKGARTIAVDQQTHRIYLPTADLEPTLPTIKPKVIPGTFEIVVLEK
ncbi:MAG TPA: YncE family protein [Bacteroidia bacterium]|nr:YncE family protein [Bacteroidia bacterium]